MCEELNARIRTLSEQMTAIDTECNRLIELNANDTNFFDETVPERTARLEALQKKLAELKATYNTLQQTRNKLIIELSKLKCSPNELPEGCETKLSAAIFKVQIPEGQIIHDASNLVAEIAINIVERDKELAVYDGHIGAITNYLKKPDSPPGAPRQIDIDLGATVLRPNRPTIANNFINSPVGLAIGKHTVILLTIIENLLSNNKSYSTSDAKLKKSVKDIIEAYCNTALETLKTEKDKTEKRWNRKNACITSMIGLLSNPQSSTNTKVATALLDKVKEYITKCTTAATTKPQIAGTTTVSADAGPGLDPGEGGTPCTGSVSVTITTPSESAGSNCLSYNSADCSIVLDPNIAVKALGPGGCSFKPQIIFPDNPDTPESDPVMSQAPWLEPVQVTSENITISNINDIITCIKKAVKEDPIIQKHFDPNKVPDLFCGKEAATRQANRAIAPCPSGSTLDALLDSMLLAPNAITLTGCVGKPK